jgi:predicted Zn-dependent protease
MCNRTVWVLTLLLAFSCLPLAQAEDVQFLMNTAAQKASEGHFRAAEKRYRAVLEQDSTQSQAMFGLAAALKAQGKNPEAITLLENLIAQHPDFQAAYYLLGMIYESQGDLARAKQAYHTYVAVAPTNIPPDPEIRIKLRGFGVF